MHWKYHIPNIVRIASNAIFTALLLYWTYLAFYKFQNQPISSFISYTKGDDNENIKFPYVTFCSMYNGRRGFFATILESLKANASFDLDNFLSSQSPNLSELFVDGTFSYEGYTKALNITRDHFYPLIHTYWGPCFGLDSKNVSISVSDGSNTASTSRLKLAMNLSAFKHDYILVTMHSRYDLADAIDTNPYTSISTKERKRHYFKLKKRLIEAESTRKYPCQEFDMKTCYDVEGNTRVAEKLGCKVPFIYNGKHLEKYVPEYLNLPACKNKDLLDALNLFWGEASDPCRRSRACQSTKYDFKYLVYEPDDTVSNEASVFSVTFSTFEVDHYVTYISYDFQSLIAELGGLLGMTLGLSFTSVGDLVANIIKERIYRIA